MNLKLFFLILLISQIVSADINKPCGRMIDIGEHKLHIYEMGTGVPVVLDACLGNNIFEWTLVQPGVAQFAHCISYDRSGLGWSEKSSLTRTSRSIVEELRVLLKNAGIKPPYILVGHSSGGINMRLFANIYPEEVFGLILVDSSYEDQHIEWKRLQELHKPAVINAPMATNPLAWLPEEFRETYQKLFSNPEAREAGGFEYTYFEESFDQIKNSANGLLDKPLIVITRGTKVVDNAHLERAPFEQAWHRSWLEFQKNLVALSTKGKQIIADGSGHMIQRERPDIIIDAIHEMVQQYRQS